MSAFAPTSGGVGAVVTITGSALTGATEVRFGGASATFTADSATQLTAVVPAAATTGPISVTTPGGTVTSASSFTVTTPSPPPSGGGGGGGSTPNLAVTLTASTAQVAPGGLVD